MVEPLQEKYSTGMRLSRYEVSGESHLVGPMDSINWQSWTVSVVRIMVETLLLLVTNIMI